MRRYAVALAAAALLLGAHAVGAPTWGAPVQISSGDRALVPELAVNGAGDALVVWDQEVGADCIRDPASTFCVHIVQLAARAAGSATWGAPIELSRPGVGAAPRGAIGASGDAAVGWVHDIGDDRVLQATYRRGLSGSFPEPNDISGVVRAVRNHRVAVDGRGNAVLAWAERPPTQGAFDAMAAVRPASSGAWSAPMMLSSSTWRVAAGPELAVAPNGVALVSWIEHDGTVRAASGDLAAATWSTPVDVARGARSAAGIDVAVNEAGEAAVVWVQGAGAAQDVRAAVRARSFSWMQPADIGTPRAGAAAGPTVAVSAAGEVVAAWLAPGGIAAATRSVAGVWRTSYSTAPGATALAFAMSASGNAVMAWTPATDGAVVASLRPGALGEWLTAKAVSASGSSRLDLALDGEQRTIAVWNRAQGPHVAVETADLDPRGPVLAGFRLPARALVAGSRGRFSIRPAAWAAPLEGQPRWTFGDGSEATGRRVAHSYSRTGRFTVAVSQADAAGEVSTSRATIRVIGARVRNVRPPSIRGTPRVGRTLLCLRGAWSGSLPIRFAYGWRRDGQVTGVKEARYRLGPSDAGSLVGCEVVATNPAGSARARSGLVGVER